MADDASDRPLTSSDLAERTGLYERWVREWLHNQSATGSSQWPSERAIRLVA